MMNYEQLKSYLLENLKNYLPDRFQGMDLRVVEVEKINRKREGIILFSDENHMSPVIYIDEIYRAYQASGNAEKILSRTAKQMEEQYRMGGVYEDLNFDNAKDNIVARLINREQNRELLKDIPSRDCLDLSIIYYWIVDMNENGIAKTLVTNDVAEKLQLSEEQLYGLAWVNTRRMFPPLVRSMNDVLKEIYEQNGMPKEVIDLLIGDFPDIMWVIGNEQKDNGAISVIYDDVLSSVAQKAGGDLYIMPSTIDEMIAVPAAMGEPEGLAYMVTKTNMEMVELEERLSNQVYHYDKNQGKLSLATNTPNKRLDRVFTVEYGEGVDKPREDPGIKRKKKPEQKGPKL